MAGRARLAGLQARLSAVSHFPRAMGFSNQFDGRTLELMLKPPIAPDSEQMGARIKYEIHHKQRVVEDGAVYDVDNRVLVSPTFHVKMQQGN